MKQLILASLLVILVTLSYLFQQHILHCIHWIQSLGMLAPIFFLLLYCLATLLFLPTMVIALAGGALFGPFLGTIFNLFGATLGAACAFCISRYWFFEIGSSTAHPSLKRLMKGVEKSNWQFVALLRIVPLIPFNLVNYGLGLTKIKLSHYLITTIVFLIPSEIILTYCGFIGIDILQHTNKLHTMMIILAIILLFSVWMWLRKQHLARDKAS